MPELDIQTFTVCLSCVEFAIDIKCSDGDSYYTVQFGKSIPGPNEYNWHCTCKGYMYRGYCRHIEEAKKNRCGWNENAFIGSGETDLKSTCPKCGGPTKAIKVGV